MGGKVTMNVTNIDQYGDLKVSPKMKPQQLELEFNYHCRIIYKVTGETLFEISGRTPEESRQNALTVVMSLLTDWNTLNESAKKSAAPHVRYLVAALTDTETDHIKYEVA